MLCRVGVAGSDVFVLEGFELLLGAKFVGLGGELMEELLEGGERADHFEWILVGGSRCLLGVNGEGRCETNEQENGDGDGMREMFGRSDKVNTIIAWLSRVASSQSVTRFCLCTRRYCSGSQSSALYRKELRRTPFKHKYNSNTMPTLGRRRRAVRTHTVIRDASQH